MNPPTPIPAGEPGADMNVRHVHSAIWRETAEPREMWRRTPWFLIHFYFILFLWLVIYLSTFTGRWKWNEYEENSLRRLRRETDRARLEATAH